MPRPPIPNYWRNRVFSHLSNAEKLSNRKIFQLLKKEAEELKNQNHPESRILAMAIPSERSIDRIHQEWEGKPELERSQYKDFYWPESMELGDLPWEASSAALELLSHMAMSNWDFRPSLRAVKWFWRVCQAAPDAPLEVRVESAVGLMVTEATRNCDEVRGIEGFLAYGPWRNKNTWDRYNDAITRYDDPLPRYPVLNYDLAKIDSEAFNFLMGVDAVIENIQH